MKNLHDLLEYQIKNIFDAENQLIKALPLLEKASSNFRLKKIFSQHFEETHMHIDRILGMAQDLNINPKGKSCKFMQGLIENINTSWDLGIDNNIKDALLISYAQRIENYEIASYRNLIHYAQGLGYNYLVQVLQQNSDEETNTFETLTMLLKENMNNQPLLIGGLAPTGAY